MRIRVYCFINSIYRKETLSLRGVFGNHFRGDPWFWWAKFGPQTFQEKLGIHFWQKNRKSSKFPPCCSVKIDGKIRQWMFWSILLRKCFCMWFFFPYRLCVFLDWLWWPALFDQNLTYCWFGEGLWEKFLLRRSEIFGWGFCRSWSNDWMPPFPPLRAAVTRDARMPLWLGG